MEHLLVFAVGEVGVAHVGVSQHFEAVAIDRLLCLPGVENAVGVAAKEYVLPPTSEGPSFTVITGDPGSHPVEVGRSQAHG